MKIIRGVKDVLRRIASGFTMDWKSKLVDLLIVIIGITLAFRLNSWSESKKQNRLINDYLNSFSVENQSNIDDLNTVLGQSNSQQAKIDTLKQIMLKEAYYDRRLTLMTPSLLNSINYRPSIITMENVKESGDFELIKNYQLRKKIIIAYESLQNLKEQEVVLRDYVKNLIRPYFFEKIRYRDFYPVDDASFVSDHRFENMIIGYGILLKKQTRAYKDVMSKLQNLKEGLESNSKR